MQQSNLSQSSCLSMGSKVVTNNNQNINNNNNNNGTVASRMLHSLINQYDNNHLNNNNVTGNYNNNNNNKQSIPQQSPREQYTIEQNYYKSNLIVMKIGNNGQQIQDGLEEVQYLYKQQQFSQRSRLKQNELQRVDDDDFDSRSQNNNTNQNIQNNNNNNNNNNTNTNTNQNILQSYRSNMSIQSQSQLVELMVKRQSQLKELQNFIMKQIQQINQSKQRNSRIKQCIANVNNGIKQTRELYCESKQSINREMKQMREFMMERFQDMIVALINEHKQSTQVYIGQIDDLRRQLQKKQTEIKRLQQRQQQQQRQKYQQRYQQQQRQHRRQFNNNKNISNNSNLQQAQHSQHCQHSQQLQVSFSADNNETKQRQLINTILISQQQQQQHPNHNHYQQQQQLNVKRQNDNDNNDNNGDDIDTNRVRFQQVQASSIHDDQPDRITNSQQQQQQQHNQQNPKHNQKSLTHSHSRSYSQKRLNHHHYNNSQSNPINQQTSQVLRMNTMSFSLNNGNDQLSTINQLDVFSQNGFINNNDNNDNNGNDNFIVNHNHNQNNNDNDFITNNGHYEQQVRKSVIRSQGGGVYSFKKNNTHKRHISGDDNFREQSVVDIKVDHCDQNNYVDDAENTGENNLQKDTKTNTKTITTTTRNKDSTQSVVIPKLPTLSSPSLINLHPVPLQQPLNDNQLLPSSSQTTKRRKSPHRYDYCRLYQQQQLREIENLNDMCSNILLRGNSNGNMTKSNDIIQRNFIDSNDDVIKMRLSQLKKDSYPSFSGSNSSSNTPKLYHVGNHINSNNNNLLMSSPSIIGLSKSNNSPLHSNSHSHSHSRKKLTIEIPQSPNLQHNPSQHNPYYKIQNHVHQMSVHEFSPQRERLRDNLSNGLTGLNGRNVSGRYQININDNQAYKETTQSIKDRKEYIRSKIQNIKKKNNLTSNNNNIVINNNNNNNIYKESQQYTNSKSPRVISFLKSSQEQQNTPSRVQLQRPSVVNRVGMMVTINNNNSNDRSLSNKDRFNNSNKQLQMQRSQQHLIISDNNVVNTNSRHADVSIKIKERLQRQNKYQKKSSTKGYDFTQDKLEKKMKQNNLPKNYSNNNNISTYNNKSKQQSFIYTREFSQQNSVHSNKNNSNNIYQQLNHHNNNNNSNNISNKPAFNNNYRNNNINNTIISSSSNTMSPLKVSTRNNNSLYLHQQQSSLSMTATKKHSISNSNAQYQQHHQQSKYSQQNLFRNNPYLVANDNERKKISTSINNVSNKKSYKNYQYQQQGDNLRRYDPVKSVAGFRRF